MLSITRHINFYSKNDFKQFDGKFVTHSFNMPLKSKNTIYDFESFIQPKEGSAKPIRMNSAVLYNENEDPTGGIISFRDITELTGLKRCLSEDILITIILSRLYWLNINF